MFSTAIISGSGLLSGPKRSGSIGFGTFDLDAENNRLSVFSDREGFTVMVVWHENGQEWEVWYYEDPDGCTYKDHCDHCESAARETETDRNAWYDQDN